MRISFLTLTLLSVIYSFLGQVDAAADLFRSDTRGPKSIKANNPSGFLARAYGRPASKQGTLRDHVTNTFKGGIQDAYISTTTDVNVAKEKFKDGKFVYHLDSSKIGDKESVAEHYASQKLKNPYADEKEVSAKLIIPWAAVVKVEQKVNGVWKFIKFDDSAPAAGPSNPGDKPKTPTPADKTPTPPGSKPQTPAPGDKPQSKIPVPASNPAQDTKSAPETTKPAPITAPGSKIPTLTKPKKKGGKRHARDITHGDEIDVEKTHGDVDELYDDADEYDE
ncbi:uncharacterized protein K489DRAFT_370249 [Dissoconium aciculare CBS 342.82]|uniref:ADP-ribosylation n=1 Tax=Dissoconium aciculare CBS 342.82 TaxID=1314786 RepID=A0A6J3M6W2_9PEZI|nr:uncharacterized protein K489DRAFT_370249 [Dissoconium aciculare CBS 342.82]KAF1822597.1 hypothetical protein K489DRAFT_370249 [Dissoconium aciculare CBS 342.82]